MQTDTLANWHNDNNNNSNSPGTHIKQDKRTQLYTAKFRHKSVCPSSYKITANAPPTQHIFTHNVFIVCPQHKCFGHDETANSWSN